MSRASGIIQGRCPDCGAAVKIQLGKNRPGDISPHGCPSRTCEYPGCRAKGLVDQMIRQGSGEWYCPLHALLALVKELVRLYQAEGDADWNAICELVDESIPDVIAKIDT